MCAQIESEEKRTKKECVFKWVWIYGYALLTLWIVDPRFNMVAQVRVLTATLGRQQLGKVEVLGWIYLGCLTLPWVLREFRR